MSDSLQSLWNFSGQNTEVGSLSLLQQIFQTQESNQGLLHYRQILYQLNYQGSPRRQPLFCGSQHMNYLPYLLLGAKLALFHHMLRV